MAGGTFNGVEQVRPGTYIDTKSTRHVPTQVGQRGIIVLPLINHRWGPAETFLSITMENPDRHYNELGYSVYDATDPQMLLIREGLKKATTVIVYIPKAGTKATATSDNITATAKYGGSRGNDLKFESVANPVDGFDVSIYMGVDLRAAYEELKTVEELKAASSELIDFIGTGDLTAFSAVSLKGGEDGATTNADIVKFLDASEKVKWNVMAFPVSSTEEEAPALFAALKAKIKYLRENTGKWRRAVCSGFAADYEGIDNLTNGVVLQDGTSLAAHQCTVYLAAMAAAASKTTSNTNREYEGAVDIVGEKGHEEAVAAIKSGEVFFSFNEEGKVVVEYDINSLTTFTDKKTKDYRKNRPIRVHDAFRERCALEFPPNRFDNNTDGWDIMDGLGRNVLREFQDEGAITEVDIEADFAVDRTKSDGDSTWIIAWLKAVDSSEKIYIELFTR